MRVHFVNRYYRPDHSATAQILTDVAESLAARGHEVRVITSRQRIDAPAASLPTHEILDRVSVLRVRTPFFGRHHLLGRLIDYLGFYIGAAWRVLRDARPGDVVVAKTDPPLLGVWLAPVVRLRGARSVNWLQDVYPEVAQQLDFMPRAAPLWRLLMRLRDWSLARAAGNVVIGRAMRELLMRRGLAGAQLTHIPNFSARLPYHPAPESDNPLRRQLGIAVDDVLIAYSGNLGRAHPVDGWLEAARLLRDDARLHFLCIGDGAGRPPLEAAVAEHGLRRWHFLPYQPRERLGESLGAADMHLVMLDPRLEGLILPSKLYGVLACGRPCLYLGDPASEIPELLTRLQCGDAANPSDGRAVARIIRGWADDPMLRVRMGGRARRGFETEFTRERVAEDWDRFLQALS